MTNKCFSLVAALTLLPFFGFSQHTHHLEDPLQHRNNISPRFQWNENSGYCGEVCLISAGLFYGQYVSQYDARAIAIKNAPQNEGQLLLGKNDSYAASQMHLNCIEWNTVKEQNTNAFLSWVKQMVVRGFPVAIGVYTNEYLFYQDQDPNAGDPDYDHIVSVTGVGSQYSLTSPTYYGTDILYFSDNGLWGDPNDPPYNFQYTFNGFQADREQANAKDGAIYSLSNDASNYGIAITGVMDEEGDTLPVRIDTNLNYEKPEIVDGSNTRPAPMPLDLQITVSGLEPGVVYNLYRYNAFESVPNSKFNANAKNASQNWQFSIEMGSTYVMQEQINSDEIAVYRAVKATAP